MSRRNFGSIRKLASGRFQASYLGTDGARVNAPTTFVARADANSWLVNVEADKIRGVLGKPKITDLKLSTYTVEWLKHRQLRPRSIEHYELILRVHILPMLGNINLPDLDPPTVRRWHANLATGPAMKANAYRLLHAIMATAEEDELIVRNPCKIKGARRSEPKPRVILEPSQLATVIEGLPDRYKTLGWLTTYGALRHSEAIGLRRKDVDLEAGTITVVEILYKVKGKWVVGKPKTKAGERTIHLPASVVGKLREHLDRYVGTDPTSRLFTTKYNNPVDRTDFRSYLKAAGQRIGRGDLFPHLLRHCGLSMFARTGATSAELLARGGHTSMSVAMVYQHSTSERDREMANRLELL
jgi:integrase